MKPKPLKGNYDGIYFKKDIRSAVRYLRLKLAKTLGKVHIKGEDAREVWKIIDQAFEDVVKKEEKINVRKK